MGEFLVMMKAGKAGRRNVRNEEGAPMNRKERQRMRRMECMQSGPNEDTMRIPDCRQLEHDCRILIFGTYRLKALRETGQLAQWPEICGELNHAADRIADTLNAIGQIGLVCQQIIDEEKKKMVQGGEEGVGVPPIVH
jgi:hypothetical protein